MRRIEALPPPELPCPVKSPNDASSCRAAMVRTLRAAVAAPGLAEPPAGVGTAGPHAAIVSARRTTGRSGRGDRDIARDGTRPPGGIRVEDVCAQPRQTV